MIIGIRTPSTIKTDIIIKKVSQRSLKLFLPFSVPEYEIGDAGKILGCILHTSQYHLFSYGINLREAPHPGQ